MPDTTPQHFDFPFTLRTDNTAQTVVQDTLDDVVASVSVAILTIYSTRPEVPTYGVPDPVFELQPLVLHDLLAAVETLEPRAALLITQIPDSKDPLIDRISAVVSLRSAVSGQ